MRLSDKVALVTGSSRGIGRAIALRFAAEGADVVINYSRDAEAATEVLQNVEKLGRNGLLVQADMSRVDDAQRLVTQAHSHFGRIDVLVNNAGIEVHAPFCEVTEADYDRVLDVNLKGVFFATQTFVNLLREGKRPGKVINISSCHEELPFPNFAPYCASKGGVRMLTRTLAVELGPFGITVNGIAPGAIETPINAKLLRDPSKLKPLLKNIPLGRVGQADDVAGLAAFLASGDADYVTGSTYFIDGGLTWQYTEQ
jgi:glucose 1-dehydrogenase